MNIEDIGTKIMITGCCGSGKSTLSRKLSDCTGLPLFHLDMIWWRPDETNIPQDEFDRILMELTAGDQWIIEGDYSLTYEARLRACDTLIFLDYDEETCMEGLRQRVGQKRSDIPWVEKRLEQELVDLVYSYRQDKRPKLLSLLEQYPEKRVLIFHNRTEADAWLKTSEQNMSKKYYVYILRCADDTLYTGWTTDVEKRVATHNAGKGAKYTRARLPVELVHTEEFDDKIEAQKREYAIKQLTRAEKEALIESEADADIHDPCLRFQK